MVNVLTPHRPSNSRTATPPPRLSAREDLLTVAFTGWLILGLFVDGWAHNNDKPETFFTPWHGLIYSGFIATALWMWSRYQRHGRAPVGYGLGMVGLLLLRRWRLPFGSLTLLFGTVVALVSAPEGFDMGETASPASWPGWPATC